jgi:soluble lytic murein transglycosylase
MPAFAGMANWLILLCMAPLLFSPPAFAVKNAASTVMDQDWQKTFALMEEKDDPIAQNLTRWIYVTETDLPVNAKELMDFVRANPGWPRLHIFRERIEENIATAAKPWETAEWFDQYPPRTSKGIRARLDALLALGDVDRAKAALSAFWREAGISKNEVAALAGAYKQYFSPTDHAARLDNLIWEDRYAEAEYMLTFVGPDTRALGQARIALGRLSSKADKLLTQVPQDLQQDPGLLYERLRWRRRKNMDDGALKLLMDPPENLGRPELWWNERNILSRRAIEKRDYALAYKIVKDHQLEEGVDFAQAEWLAGWLLMHLNQPESAYLRFDNLYRRVNSAISHSRAAYWAARSAEASGNAKLSLEWDKVGARYPSTFYGQLSYQRLYGTPDSSSWAEAPPPVEVQQAFDSNDLVRAIKILGRLKFDRFIEPFLAGLLNTATHEEDYLLAAKLAREVGKYYFVVDANKTLQQRLGGFLFTEGYPLLPSVPSDQPEKALIHAIVYRESMFDTNAVSPAGARGLMQLMPATAKTVSKKRGRAYTLGKLTDDPPYNVTLGAAYLQELLENYGGSYPLAVAAYNAGPGRVREWIATFGDPRAKGVDIIDWIEHIPVYETRNYIQRVMETYYMYKLKFDESPKTVAELLRQ